jgi:hypothetical protein
LSTLSRRFELRFALITAFALLIAQFGAMAHAYSHVPDIRPATTLQSSGAHDFCSDCLSFAPLLSAAGAPAALPRIEPPALSLRVPAELRSLVDSRPRLAFRSRAPPSHAHGIF